jgi:eukaryotic-like serine/threonine-protein kinase
MELGPYEILGILGEGGMGTVYRARHRELGVERALKVLLGGTWTPSQLGRFEREIEILGRLRHPNIVAIHEAGTD